MKQRKKRHLLDSLDRTIPMALSEHGIVMVFRRNLSDAEIAKAFELFHLAACLDMPSHFAIRMEDELPPINTPARAVYSSIKSCAGSTIKNPS